MKENKKLCSIVVPCYNEEDAILLYYQEMQKIFLKLSEVQFEFVFIDDGSNDHTLQEIKELHKKDKRVHYVSFSRNFGKEAGIYAGLKHSSGDYIVIMDVDLQDSPEMIPQMYDSIQSGKYDCVAARRVNRKGEPPIRSFFARIFYKMINKISKIVIVDGARDYRMMTRQMVDSILSISEYNRFSKGIFGWVGFETKWLSYENRERVVGKTKWNFWKLFTYSLEGIVAFSTIPLSIASFFGLFFCTIAFIGTIFIFVRALLFGDPVSGWPSMMCIITLLGGIQLLCMGIMGMYLSKTYLECKNRPIYIAKEEG